MRSSKTLEGDKIMKKFLIKRSGTSQKDVVAQRKVNLYYVLGVLALLLEGQSPYSLSFLFKG